MSNDILWNHDSPVADLGFIVPSWIEQDITGADIAAIVQGGCASGAYMPAVTYRQAVETMGEHGDDVLQFIEDVLGEIPPPEPHMLWVGMAVHFLSTAVELWASSVEDEVRFEIEGQGEETEEVKP